jgi:thioredoxin 2
MTLLAVCVWLCVGVFVVAASARQIDTSFPPVFSQLTLGEAKQKAMEQDRILVVKGTAGWCGPCRTMDKTTWRDAKVEAWFKEKGIAIQLNVDRSAKEAQDLRIQAIPAMVAFKGDKEIGRIIGLQTAEQLLAWLGRIEGGEKGDAGLLDRLRKVRADPKAMSMLDRTEFAKELERAGEIDQAIEEYAWLWEHMLEYDPAMLGVRASFMLSDMQQLAAKNESAKKRWVALRDKAWEGFSREAAPKQQRLESLGDWGDLNGMLGESDKNLAWFDRFGMDPEWEAGARGMAQRLRLVLIQKQRWSDIGRLFETPERELHIASLMLDEPPRGRSADDDAKSKQRDLRDFREEVGQSHAAYLAAGREKDAAALVEGAIKRDDTPAMRVELVRWAIKAKQVRESQRVWLDDAGARGEDVVELRAVLEEALKEKGSSKTP